MEFSRRRLLGVAAASAASVAGVAAASSDAIAHQSATTLGSEPAVRVEWTETHNGTVVESGSEEDGPVLGVGNAQPGDSGSLAFRVTPESGEAGARVRFSLAVTENAENGRNEPERTAGDDTPSRGELADAVETAVWYDTGSLGIGGLGGCDGDRDAAETVLVDGSLAAVDDALADGVRLGGECIPPDGGVCVGLSWALPASTGNRVQGDSVDTTLAFTAEPCGDQ